MHFNISVSLPHSFFSFIQSRYPSSPGAGQNKPRIMETCCRAANCASQQRKPVNGAVGHSKFSQGKFVQTTFRFLRGTWRVRSYTFPHATKSASRSPDHRSEKNEPVRLLGVRSPELRKVFDTVKEEASVLLGKAQQIHSDAVVDGATSLRRIYDATGFSVDIENKKSDAMWMMDVANAIRRYEGHPSEPAREKLEIESRILMLKNARLLVDKYSTE